MPADDDPNEVARDDTLLGRVNAGEGPPTGDPAGDVMAVWRDTVRDPTEQIRYTDPATTRLPLSPSPTPRVSGWVADPDEPSGWRWMPDVSAIAAATRILPVVPVGRMDWAWPSDEVERTDGWCEDRSPDLGEITWNDGED